MKSGRHLHRHCLGDLPLVLVYSSTSVESAHIARDVFKPPIDECEDVMDHLEHGLMLFNQLAIEQMSKSLDLTDIVSEDTDIRILFDKETTDINLQLFHIKPMVIRDGIS